MRSLSSLTRDVFGRVDDLHNEVDHVFKEFDVLTSDEMRENYFVKETWTPKGAGDAVEVPTPTELAAQRKASRASATNVILKQCVASLRKSESGSARLVVTLTPLAVIEDVIAAMASAGWEATLDSTGTELTIREKA